MRINLSGAHPDYHELIPPLLDSLLCRYTRARLNFVRFGPPRCEGDASLGFYDEDTQDIRFNLYWFAKPVTFLRAAATSEPLFHGPMIDEPRHVVTHEFGHALDYGLRSKEWNKRRIEVWKAITVNPLLTPADYAFSNDTEAFGELFTLVEMGLAAEAQRDLYDYILAATQLT